MPFIDRIPILGDQGDGTQQILLRADQHPQDQQTMITAVKQFIHGQYKITAQRIFLITPPPDVSPISSRMYEIDFRSAMYNLDSDSDLALENDVLANNPYVNIWKTWGKHPEYISMSVYAIPVHDTILGYFALEPLKSRPMLIDRIPPSGEDSGQQILLSADQRPQEQQTMITAVKQFIQGQYKITAQRIFLIYPLPSVSPLSPREHRGNFNNAMLHLVPHSRLVRENDVLANGPYVNIWKAWGEHPEYISMSVYAIPLNETILGYFALEPLK